MTQPLAPGSYVTVTDAPSPSTNPASTGNWFVVGMSPRGPVGSAVLVQSLAQFAAIFGLRVGYSPLYDCLDVFFRQGSKAYVSRVVGPAAIQSYLVLSDQAGSPLPTLKVWALGPGVDGNNISVQVVSGPGSGQFYLEIYYSGALVEISDVCSSPAGAVAWSAKSNYVTITDEGSATVAPDNNPAVLAATPLAHGTDDNSSVTDTIRNAGLVAFTSDLGPGQVSIPGSTTEAVHAAVCAHGQQFNRVPYNDGVDTATAATNIALLNATQEAVTDPSYTTLFAPWVIYPGIPTGTSVPAPNRILPPSCMAAAKTAANDAVNDANIAAAGPNGIDPFAIGVTQTYSDADRLLLNNAGVNVIRNIPRQGGVQVYGWRSGAVDPAWVDLSSVRFRMQLVDDATIAGASFDFAQIDGQGHVVAAFNGMLTAILAGYYAKGSLYGATPAQAFTVDTGPAVNTPATIAARQLRAVISVRMSPSAEVVQTFIVKYAVDQSLPVAA